jgi:hypothetical protein
MHQGPYHSNGVIVNAVHIAEGFGFSAVRGKYSTSTVKKWTVKIK